MPPLRPAVFNGGGEGRRMPYIDLPIAVICVSLTGGHMPCAEYPGGFAPWCRSDSFKQAKPWIAQMNAFGCNLFR
ncbi:hypothetical protein CSC3H3_22260 (plasmid) [Thalassospira marina]|uniref:Uncharacterized protein n=1 Tax=Thalassospira marina TaxID=2048283 RepID=A0ABN5FV58_9PROT|nr:hypothetical protein CSC3H3_22260 [Thalassospira marina]